MGRRARVITRVVGAVVGAVVGFIVGGPVGAVVGAVAGFGAADTVNAIINPGFAVPNIQIPQAREQLQGITINKSGTDTTLPVLYGSRHMGGSRVFVSTEGADNQFLHIVLAVCEGEISGFREIYCDDKLAWSGRSDHGRRYEASIGKFAGYMSFETYHGLPFQQFNNNGTHITLGVGGWTPAHRLQGVAYIAFKLRWLKIVNPEDQDRTPWASIPNITVVTDGRVVANAAVFANTVDRSIPYGAETQVFNVNPVSCLLDYLRNPLYGKGLSNSRIDFASFRREAQRWAVSQDGSTALSSDRFQQCNAVVFTDRTVFDNVQTFLYNMQAALPYFDGRFSVTVEDNRNNATRYGTTSQSVMTIGEDAIIGQLTVEGDNVHGKFNRIVVTYPGGRQGARVTNELIELQHPEAGSALAAAVLAEDNNRENTHEIVLEHVTQDNMARKFAQVHLAKSRFRNKTVTFVADASAHQLTINDIFTLTHSGLGINGRFRVKNIQFNNDYTFSILAEEHDDQVYGGDVEPFTRRAPVFISLGDGTAPEYRDLIRDQVIFKGNKSDLETQPVELTFTPGVLDPEPGEPGPPAGPPVFYTLAELEAGLAAGNVIAVINGSIVYAEPEYIPILTAPQITSVEIRNDPRFGSGVYDIRINFKPNLEPTITRTTILNYSERLGWQENSVSNGTTASAQGFIELSGITTSPTPIKLYKIKFTGKGSSVSDEFAVDLAGADLVDVKIISEGFE